MTRGTVRGALLVATLAPLVACTGSHTTEDFPSSRTAITATGPGSEAPAGPELTQGEGCGEVFFWAADATGGTAVTVRLDLYGELPSGVTARTVVLPDPVVEVRVLSGDDLPRNFCTDVFDGQHEPTGQQSATIGTLTMELDATTDAYGTRNGRLTIDGLVAADGTTVDPIAIESHCIGCTRG